MFSLHSGPCPDACGHAAGHGVPFSVVAVPAFLLLAASWLLWRIHNPDNCARCTRLRGRPVPRWYHGLTHRKGYKITVVFANTILVPCLLLTSLFDQPTAFLTALAATLTAGAVDLRLVLLDRAGESRDEDGATTTDELATPRS